MEKQKLIDTLTELRILSVMDNLYYKAKAYEAAIISLKNIPNIEEFIDQNKLQDIDGVGSAIESKIIEFYKTRTIQKLEELKRKYPIDVLSLNKISKISPMIVFKLYNILAVANLKDLKRVCIEGRVAGLTGLGFKIQKHILEEIKRLEDKK